MLTHLHKLKIGIALLLVGLTFSIGGCGGGNDTPEVQSQKLLSEATGFMQTASVLPYDKVKTVENFQAALLMANRSIELFPSEDAILLKAQIEVQLEDHTAAHKTLDHANAQYPKSGKDEFVRAFLLGKQGGEPAEIAKNLKLSMGDPSIDGSYSYYGMEEGSWWNSVEKAPEFASLRTSSPYTEVTALKLLKVASSGAYVCKQNVTKYVGHWYGFQIFISQPDKDEYLDTVLGTLDVIAPFLAETGVGEILAGLMVELDGTLLFADTNDCGVVFNWEWLLPGLFIFTSQN